MKEGVGFDHTISWGRPSKYSVLVPSLSDCTTRINLSRERVMCDVRYHGMYVNFRPWIVGKRNLGISGILEYCKAKS